ncbi:MAG: PilC/PilY family type IV pilus protein [Haliea sp.]
MWRTRVWLFLACSLLGAAPLQALDLDAWWASGDHTHLLLELALRQSSTPALCTLGQDCRQRFTTSAYRLLEGAHAEGAPVTSGDAVAAVIRSLLQRLPPQVTVETRQRPLSAFSGARAVDEIYLVRGTAATVPLARAGACFRQHTLSLTDTPAPGAIALSTRDPIQLERRLEEAVLGFARRSGSLVSSTFRAGASTESELLIAGFELGPGASWAGNVKKVRIPVAGAGLATVEDARGQPALRESAAGPVRLRDSAVTFWTDPARVLPGLEPPVRAGADGGAVRRGGVGQHLVSHPTVSDPPVDGGRLLLTEAPEPADHAIGPRPLVPLRADLASVRALRDSLPFADEAEGLQLLRWILGEDVDEAPQRGRAWLLGPVYHSRPLALDYGATGDGYGVSNPRVRIFFGSADGVLHAVENTDAAGRESGREVFGFLPHSSLAALLRRRSAASPVPVAYGIDGSPVVLRVDRNGDGTLRADDGDEAIVVFGLRRGGSRYYALNVSDPLQPPRLQWRLERTVGGDFDELGLTFSTPVVGRVQFDGQVRDVLLLGGGYNGGVDAATGERLGKDATAGDDPVGNAIYVVDARSGALIWKAVRGDSAAADNSRFPHPDMRDSIASEIAVLKNAAGIIHRLYVGDTGGRVWRVDLPPGGLHDPQHRARHWSASVLAELGAETVGPDDRRFFAAPALVRTVDDRGRPVDGVLITSGNRAQPLARRTVNYAFYLRDGLVRSGDARVRERLALTFDQLHPAGSCTPEQTGPCAAVQGPGWKLAMPAPGEKGWGSPVIDGGRVLFGSFEPRQAPCEAPPGRARLYAVNLVDGAAPDGGSAGWDLGVGVPSELLRAGEWLVLPGGVPEAAASGAGLLPDAALQRSRAPQLLRTYWREPGVDPL